MSTAKVRAMSVDVDEIRRITDIIDTRYGNDPIIADLILQLDNIVLTLEEKGRVFKLRRHQRAGISGFRNVGFHKETGLWVGRIRYTDKDGVKRRKTTKYYTEPAEASVEVELLRKELGLR